MVDHHAEGHQPLQSSDGNLLFGIVAMQMDFISREALIMATSVWVRDKSRPISQVLLEQGVIDRAVHDLLQGLVGKHLELHDHDPRRSLAALSSLGSLADELRSIHDHDLDATLDYVASSPDTRSSDTARHVAPPASAERRYRVLRPHARGGLGEVFVARDEDLHREVALKEIQPAYADEPSNRARFLQEAEITGRLEHPGVVPVYGLGTHADGRPYYVMRFIRGDSLKEAIQRFHRTRRGAQPAGDDADKAAMPRGRARGRLRNHVEFRQLLGRFVDVCDAIEYAHSRGVLHRDLKPGNIMLGRYGETLVVDWGLAKALGQRSGESNLDERTLHPESGSGSAPTQLGQAVGTPQYMSPEQAAGRTDDLGATSDVYSLGATLYSLLTGQVPFPSRDTAGRSDVLDRVQRGEFPPPRSLDRSIPRPLEAICLKAMALRPEARYPTPRALADDIEHWLADAAISAYGGATYRLRMWGRRHRVALVTASLILVALLAASGYYVQRTEQLNRTVVQHLNQAKLYIGADALDRGRAELAAAQALASDPAVREHWRARSADWQQKLEQYDQFLKLSRAARYFTPPGIQTFADVRAPRGPDEWTTIDFEDNDEGRQRTVEALDLLRRAERHIQAGPGLSTLRMRWHRRLGQDELADTAGDLATEMAKQPDAATHFIDQYVLAQTVQEVLKQPGDAVAIYERLLKRRPDHFRAHQGLWQCYYRLGDIEAQRRHLEVCLALDPNNSTLNYFRGMLHFGSGEYRQAFEDFDASILKDDRFAIGYFYRGRMEVVFDDWAAAERDFSAAIERDPDFDSAFHWRAIANAKLGRHAQAARDAERALSLDPDDRLTHFYAARAYAGAAGAAASDQSDETSPDEAAKRYAQRAVEILARGIELGFDDFIRLVPGSDFTPLYDRDEFLELVNQAVAQKVAEREQRLQENAPDGENRLALAELYLTQVEIRTGGAAPQEADLAALARSLELFTQLLKEEKQRRSAARLISRVVQRQGELLDRLQRDAEADGVWERLAMLEGPQQQHAVLIDRAFNLARWNDHARAVDLLQPLHEITDLPPGHCYNAACVLAIAAAKAQTDQRLPEDERTSKADQCAEQAMRFLERARDAGYFKDPAVLDHAKRDADLDSLRDRPDFQALLRIGKEITERNGASTGVRSGRNTGG